MARQELQADIVIVGGGMVGLSQALLLARELPHTRIVLFDSFAFSDQAATLLQPSFDARSTALSASTVALLKLLQLWQKLEPSAQPINRVHVSDRGHIGATDFNASENNNEPLGYVIENRCFGFYLNRAVQACSNVKLIAPANVEKVRPVAAGAEVLFRRGDQTEKLTTSLVIISDGAQSPLRKQLGIGVEEYDYQQTAVIANIEFEKPHRGQAFERFTETGPLAVLPLASSNSKDSARAALVWTQPSEKLDEVLSWSDKEFCAQLQQAFGYRLGEIVKAGARNDYPLKMLLAKEQVRSSIAVVGNAAHYLHPVAGQGFNLAIRDCAQLTAVLCAAARQGKSLGDLAVLQRYMQLQNADQKATATISHSFIRVFSQSNKLVQLGRNLGLLSLALNNRVRREFFEQMMGKFLPQAKLKRPMPAREPL